jgi:hypothetical protein
MSTNPVNVVIKGSTISGVSNFRYGQQLHDQRFFELTFQRQLFDSPFSLGSDDPESYVHQPITLQFEGALGKLRSVSGTIVKLEFINTAGQNAEVVVSGTMYQSAGYLSKFTLALMALLIAPFLFAGFLFLQVSRLSGSLVETEGTVNYFQDRTGKATHHYTFKISPYRASLHRAYHAPVFNTARENIDALFKADDGTYEANRKGQKVNFYVIKNDLIKLKDPGEKVDFLYLKSRVQSSVKFDYYYDLLTYTTDKTWFYFVWIFYLMMEVLFFTCALYCYKMYAFNQQKKNRIIWFACVSIASVLNIIAIVLML